MTDRFDDIRDDELRIIGKPPIGEPPTAPKDNHPKKRKRLWVLVVIVALLTLTAVAIYFLSHKRYYCNYKPEDIYVPPHRSEIFHTAAPTPQLLGNYSDTSGKAYTELIEKTVNDIPLKIFIPHNSVPKLKIGRPDPNDTTLIFAAQAADIRADNGKINGAFVLAGIPITWNISKKGYVAIIDGKVLIGVAETTSLLEESIEKDGYFFRQYGLVDNGILVENVPKGKSIRKAICDRKGETMIIFTSTPESFHDFSQALIDMEVDNAVYLVGGMYSYGFKRDYDGNLEEFAEQSEEECKNENYVIWELLF